MYDSCVYIYIYIYIYIYVYAYVCIGTKILKYIQIKGFPTLGVIYKMILIITCREIFTSLAHVRYVAKIFVFVQKNTNSAL